MSAEAFRAWRQGMVPQLVDTGLLALREALIANDPALLRGSTVTPWAVADLANAPCEGVCPLAFALWRGLGLVTSGSVSAAWSRIMDECHNAGLLPWIFVGWWDDTPAQEARNILLGLVVEALAARGLRTFPERQEAGREVPHAGD